MNTLASRNPDTKIKAMAALDNSQRRSTNFETNYKFYSAADISANETAIDLKSCSIYVQRGNLLLNNLGPV